MKVPIVHLHGLTQACMDGHTGLGSLCIPMNIRLGETNMQETYHFFFQNALVAILKGKPVPELTYSTLRKNKFS